MGSSPPTFCLAPIAPHFGICSAGPVSLFTFLGWEFVDSVMSSKTTFAGFVSCYDNKYKRSSYDNFMSKQTFIDWFFAWSSRMRIDFRKQCAACEGNIEILACDATKIGMGFRNTFVTPIETPEINVVPEISLKRHDRCFLSTTANATADVKRKFAIARKSLRFVCDSIITKNDQQLKDDCITLESLQEYLPENSLEAFLAMIDPKNSYSIRKSYALVFKLLSFDASVDSVIPFLFTKVVDRYLLKDNDSLPDLVEELKYTNLEFADLLSISIRNDKIAPVIKLLKCCNNMVKKVHVSDTPAGLSEPVPESYNPPKFGRAYYFSNHGCQLRQIRRFPIDVGVKGNFDDVPDVYCAKRFPVVSKKGVSYLFLWFCPIHGHCYGYHIIPGSEGRKDPATSLYAYLETAPSTVLYDFACSLSEYTRNRESGYLKILVFSMTYFMDLRTNAHQLLGVTALMDFRR